MSLVAAIFPFMQSSRKRVVVENACNALASGARRVRLCDHAVQRYRKQNRWKFGG